MKITDTVVATFDSQISAEESIKELFAEAFDLKDLSIVGKDYRTDEQVVGLYNTGDHIRFGDAKGAFWGGVWGLLTDGVFITLPLFGTVLVLGNLATMVVAEVQNAVVVGGFTALGAALDGLGIPKNGIITYERAIKAHKFLVVVHGSSSELARAKIILEKFKPSELNHHETSVANKVV
jgi:uncharacterized membrane protein